MFWDASESDTSSKKSTRVKKIRLTGTFQEADRFIKDFESSFTNESYESTSFEFKPVLA